jgi:hypothetical protein
MAALSMETKAVNPENLNPMTRQLSMLPTEY